jgi:sigma-B regulation protein RsbU (phosphoserine phosphatase)
VPVGGFVGLAIGIVLLTVGGLACATAALARPRPALSLAAFGLFSGLYGLRLLADSHAVHETFGGDPVLWLHTVTAVTYIIPAPGIYFSEQFFGRGWKSSVRRLWQIQLAFAAGAIAWDAVKGPGASMPFNNPLVLLAMGVAGLHLAVVWRRFSRTRENQVVLAGAVVFGLFVLNQNIEPHPVLPEENVEPIGMLAFVACLGYFAVWRTIDAERRLLAIGYELSTAREIQQSILPRRPPLLDGLAIEARYVPIADVAGDFYEFVPVDPRRAGILVADVSGHGVPAALIGSMLKVAVAAQAGHAADPAAVLAGINAIFCGKLERAFITAVYVYLDLDAGRLLCGNAGHPPLLIRRRDGAVEAVREHGIFLGQFAGTAYASTPVPLAPGDRLVLYTDGVLEARSPRGEFFDEERLRRFVQEEAGGAAAFADRLLGTLSAWSGEAGRPNLDDDVTLVVVDVMKAGPMGQGSPTTSRAAASPPRTSGPCPTAAPTRSRPSRP